MIIIDDKKFIIIKVISKQTQLPILIKSNRFNPEIHTTIDAMINDAMEDENLVITTSDPGLDTSVLETASITPVVQISDAPIEKRRGMPKGGWPKKT